MWSVQFVAKDQSIVTFLYLGTPDNGRPQFLIEGSDADALTVTPVGILPEGLKPKDAVKFENMTLDLVPIGGSRTKVSGLNAVIKKENETVSTTWANESARTMVVVKGEYFPVVDADFFTGSFMYGATRDVFETLNYQEQQDRGSRVGDLIAKDVRVSDENGKALSVRVPKYKNFKLPFSGNNFNILLIKIKTHFLNQNKKNTPD